MSNVLYQNPRYNFRRPTYAERRALNARRNRNRVIYEAIWDPQGSSLRDVYDQAWGRVAYRNGRPTAIEPSLRHMDRRKINGPVIVKNKLRSFLRQVKKRKDAEKAAKWSKVRSFAEKSLRRYMAGYKINKFIRSRRNRVTA